jgi:hypothetical protein
MRGTYIRLAADKWAKMLSTERVDSSKRAPTTGRAFMTVFVEEGLNLLTTEATTLGNLLSTMADLGISDGDGKRKRGNKATASKSAARATNLLEFRDQVICVFPYFYP